MKAGIRTYLLADTTLAAALSATTAIYSFPIPAGTAKPYLILSRVSGVPQNLLANALGTYVEAWQVDVIASTDSEAETIKELVIARLNTADFATMGDYHVYSCSCTGITNNSDLEIEGSESAVNRTTLEFEVLRNIAANGD